MSPGRGLGRHVTSAAASRSAATALHPRLDAADVAAAPGTARRRRHRRLQAASPRTSGVPRRRSLGAAAGGLRVHARDTRLAGDRVVQRF